MSCEAYSNGWDEFSRWSSGWRRERHTTAALEPALFMNTSAAIADPLLRRAFGRRARPSYLRRTARVRLRSSGLRAPLSPSGSAISRRTVMNNAGYGCSLTLKLRDWEDGVADTIRLFIKKRGWCIQSHSPAFLLRGVIESTARYP